MLAVESAAAAWKNRALMAEETLKLARINGAEIDTSSLVSDQMNVGRGRLEMLPNSDSRIKDLLENGPRRETPEWMQRRLQTGHQGLPPMKPTPTNAEVEATIPLQLPSPEKVWDVSRSKAREDDKFSVRAAEKEALDLQRSALERALETRSIKPLVRYPEDSEKISGLTAAKHHCREFRLECPGFSKISPSFDSPRTNWCRSRIYVIIEPKVLNVLYSIIVNH